MSIGNRPGPAAGGPESDPLLDFTGDADAAQLLRHNLAGIAQQTRGTSTGALVDEVLAGRRPVRELEQDAGFMELTRAGVDDFRRHMAALDPDERQKLVDEAERLASSDE